MRSTIGRTLMALCVLGLMTACAQPAREAGMVIGPVAESARLATTVPALSSAVAVGQISGGSATNPMGMSQVDDATIRGALRASMTVHGILSNDPNARYQIAGHLNELQQPFFGVDVTVTSNILWTLLDRISGAVVFREQVVTPYTARFSDAFVGVERLRLANEGAIKANLTKLFERLAVQPLTPQTPTVTPAPAAPAAAPNAAPSS
ncbi:MAG: hypothetical protein SF002_13005 [Alphaproteobacteria bacterium]|nr:hypothetical protein [Alphaproteobacteria bacterium]